MAIACSAQIIVSKRAGSRGSLALRARSRSNGARVTCALDDAEVQRHSLPCIGKRSAPLNPGQLLSLASPIGVEGAAALTCGTSALRRLRSPAAGREPAERPKQVPRVKGSPPCSSPQRDCRSGLAAAAGARSLRQISTRQTGMRFCSSRTCSGPPQPVELLVNRLAALQVLSPEPLELLARRDRVHLGRDFETQAENHQRGTERTRLALGPAV